MVEIKLEPSFQASMVKEASKMGMENLEEYIIYIIKKDINSIWMNTKFPKVLEHLDNLDAGEIFCLADLVEIELQETIGIESIQQLEEVFENYLARSGKINEYNVLFFDEKTFMYYYIKK